MEQTALIIYRKTDKGLEELQSRSHGLEQRFRRALFLVDGRKDMTEFSAIMRPGEAKIALTHLASGGFIVALRDDEIPADLIRYIAIADVPQHFAKIKSAVITDFAKRLGAFADTVIAEVESCNTSIELRMKLRDIEEILIAAIGQEEGVNLAREIGGELSRLVRRDSLA